jgi:hypothetical protein
MLGSSRAAAQLAASQEGLSSMSECDVMIKFGTSNGLRNELKSIKLICGDIRI